MEKSPTLVRKAKSADIPYILDLYKKGLEELGLEYQESLLVKKIVDSLKLAPCFLLIKDEIVGMWGLTMGSLSHSGELVVQDYMLYIEPEHRGMKTLGEMVEYVKSFADENKLIVRLEHVGRNPELSKRLYKMHGFEPTSVIGEYHGR